jgi:DNA gyrase inhibitor GyrI
MATKKKDSRNDDQPRSGGRRGRYVLAGIGLLAVAGAGYVLYREKSIEKPKHKVGETDGQFEVRDYPELLVAETKVAGERAAALDQGFSRLADYIFAKSRGGEKVPMTAPVLSSSGGNGEWLTRFVMPARFTRDTLPEAGDGVRIGTLPARRVAAMAFSGTADDATLTEKEALLRSWLGAKKYNVRGEAEHAFYNSPFIPAAMRRTEILIPIE